MRAYCTSCGAPMEAEDRHCPRCGRLQSGPLLVRSGPEEEPAAEAPQPLRAPVVQAEPPTYIRPRHSPDPPGGGFDRRLLLPLGLVLLLLIFVIGLAIGRLTSSGARSAAAGRPSSPAAPAVVTPTPSSVPTATPAHPAQFVSMNQTITDRCSTANGCPVSATFKNQGAGRGSGTAKLDVVGLQDSVVYASCTVPIPDTDPGATVTVSCNANSPGLAGYWKQGPQALVKPLASAV